VNLGATNSGEKSGVSYRGGTVLEPIPVLGGVLMAESLLSESLPHLPSRQGNEKQETHRAEWQIARTREKCHQQARDNEQQNRKRRIHNIPDGAVRSASGVEDEVRSAR
jgi:hypothetical protein